MISLNLAVSDAQFRLLRNALQRLPGAAEKALVRAVNRAVEGARTDAIRAVCKEYVIKPADVRKTIHIVRAKPDNPEAQVISTGRPIPLIKFRILPKNPPARGTSVKNRKTVIAGVKFNTATAAPHSFIARMKNGHVGVYSRPPGVGRNPIEQRYGPSVPQMIGSQTVLEYIETQAHERLDKELGHQVKYLLGGGK
ncbi:MAG: phage tail protein [Synergistaceae bacterium]|jgi:hypothetical protein|nr:phage tail protein [Synergistaceae bacterium]